MSYLRLLLLPFSLCYGIVIWLRNRLYDWGWLKQHAFAAPVIVVGNLEVGGTGKSPMTEYLIRLLKDDCRLATLSRGYGRNTKGFLEVTTETDATQSGDEPLQFKQKFSEITVAVCESRVKGVERLLPGHDVVLLDDAFQHRALKPGFSILLFDFNKLDQPTFLLPAGDYRDLFAERRRADVFVVTKCPEDLSATQKKKISAMLAVKGQKSKPILFASLQYDPIQFPKEISTSAFHNQELRADTRVLAITGIARPQPFIDHVSGMFHEVSYLAFRDHYPFTLKDIQDIAQRFEQIAGKNKLIITTEKDITRLMSGELCEIARKLPLCYIPISHKFSENDKALLNARVLEYCKANKKKDKS